MAFVVEWNVSAQKFYESGLDRAVLYVRNGSGLYTPGVPWEGMINVADKPGGAEPTTLYALNEEYAKLVSKETYAGSIEAYTFPDEFMPCDGLVEHDPGFVLGQQARSVFGLSYRTFVGSDAAGSQSAYKIHLVYGCLIQPSEVAHATINESPEAVTFSWEFTTTPVAVTGYNAISKIVLDSRTLDPGHLTAIEEQLYGEDGGTPVTPNLPLPDALIALLV